MNYEFLSLNMERRERVVRIMLARRQADTRASKTKSLLPDCSSSDITVTRVTMLFEKL